MEAPGSLALTVDDIYVSLDGMVELLADSPSPTEVLHARATAIRAVRGVEMNAFWGAVEQLGRAADAAGVPVAVVGGLAAIRRGTLVTTVEIDIVIPADGFDAFLTAAEQCGLTLKTRAADGWHRLEYRDGVETVGIEVVPEGGRTLRNPADAPAVPHPRELGVAAGLGYASLEGWIALKLVANRDKDRYHLTEALKAATPEQIAACMQAVRKLPPRYLKVFERLVRAA